MQLPSEYVLGLDPSGSFNEGKGTTGWCLFECKTKTFIELGELVATNFNLATDYWNAHTTLINRVLQQYKSVAVVCEDYFLYASKALAQINSRMETSQLIGIIKYYCAENKIPLAMQGAGLVKDRWKDRILIYKKHIQREGTGNWYKANGAWVSEHTRDAMRHALHFAYFKNKEK